MHLSQVKKNLLFGFLTALCLTTIILGVSFVTTTMNMGATGLLPSFDWDIDSPVKLSNQMLSRSDFLYAMAVNVGRALEDGGCIFDIPYFNYSVNTVHVWFNLEAENWLLVYDAVGSSNLYDTYYVINPDILVNLPSALSSDIQTIDNLTDITENYQELRQNLVKENMTEYDIVYFYQDGSIIRLLSFDDVVFIQLNRFTEYDSGYTHWFGKVDDNFHKIWYLGYMEEQFPNYTVAINQLLENFFESQ
ncbi:MAG: hypothetical protein HGN29_13020 [Asgard group archaeon]|nr:hypothetical protein [Asgard group archaeon]